MTGRLPNGAGLGHLEEEGRGWIQTSEDLDFNLLSTPHLAGKETLLKSLPPSGPQFPQH